MGSRSSSIPSNFLVACEEAKHLDAVMLVGEYRPTEKNGTLSATSYHRRDGGAFFGIKFKTAETEELKNVDHLVELIQAKLTALKR